MGWCGEVVDPRVCESLLKRLSAYVRRNRWEGLLSVGEHEREDLGDRVRREGFLLLYNRSLLPDPRVVLVSWGCCRETLRLSVSSEREQEALMLMDISGEFAAGIWSNHD
jgi:hypothetical protein